jgi:hypothetical protein
VKENQQAEQAAEKVLFVIPSEARDLLFLAKPKKKQIPRANPALRNDTLRVFPQPLKRVLLNPIGNEDIRLMRSFAIAI